VNTFAILITLTLFVPIALTVAMQVATLRAV
jgi:hypothetical protein